MTLTSLADVRAREYPNPTGRIFLDAASHGLIPQSAVEAVSDLVARRNRAGGFDESDLGRGLWRCREALARLLDVEASEISLAPNTSYGVGMGAALVASGEPGTVLVSHGEFAANVYPWLALERRGFKVELVPTDTLGRPDEGRLLDGLMSEDVRALALSVVQFSTGFRADLETLGEACRERGILFILDAIQALGAVPLRPREVGADVVAAGGQKWLCAPWGSGFLWMDPAHRDRFDPPLVSWLAMPAARDFGHMLDYTWDFLPDGRKFELATLGIQDYLGLERSVRIFLEMGMEQVADHIRRLHAPVLDWMDGRDDVTPVTPREPRRRAGILAFRLRELTRVAEALRQADVMVSVREGALRLAPHFYNTVDEMERVVEVLDGAL